MSSKMSSLLVQQGLITVNDLQDALALQVVRGGALDTVLLERGLVTESDLVDLLAEVTGNARATPELFALASPEAADEIPQPVAERLGICPIAREGDRLRIVSSASTDNMALPELAYELNCVIIPASAPELRVIQARSIVYGTTIPPRFATLLSKCGEAPGSAPDPIAFAAQTADTQTADTQTADTQTADTQTADTQTADTQTADTQTTTSSQTQAQQEDARHSAPFSFPPLPGAAQRRRRLSDALRATPSESTNVEDAPPLLPGMAEQLLRQAETRDEVLLAFLRAAHYFLGAAYLYSRKGDQLVGYYAVKNSRLDTNQIRGRRLGLDMPSVVSRAVNEGRSYVGPAPDTDASATVLLDAEIVSPYIALVPIRIKDRTVCLLIGHRNEHPISEKVRTPLEEIAGLAATALANVILKQKKDLQPRHAVIVSGQDLIASRTNGPRSHQVSGEIGASPRATSTARPSSGSAGPAPQSGESKVIVDFDVDIGTRPTEELLDALDQNPEQTEDILGELRRRESTAIEWLLDNFPGKLRFDRTEVSELPAVGDCSAVLQALLHIGRPVLPKLAPLLLHGREQTRFFATYLLSELTFPESVSLLAERLQDSSPSVRRVASYALRQCREIEQFPRILDDLRADLSHPDTRPQRAAMAALAALGDVVATPSLIAMLKDDRIQIPETAHRALIMLTKQDHGSKTSAWMAWWNRNRTRHRIEWLIDGLVHTSKEIRESSADELLDLTGMVFDYRADMPAAGREEVRKKFLTWWSSTGLYDFGRFA